MDEPSQHSKSGPRGPPAKKHSVLQDLVYREDKQFSHIYFIINIYEYRRIRNKN